VGGVAASGNSLLRFCERGLFTLTASGVIQSGRPTMDGVPGILATSSLRRRDEGLGIAMSGVAASLFGPAPLSTVASCSATGLYETVGVKAFGLVRVGERVLRQCRVGTTFWAGSVRPVHGFRCFVMLHEAASDFSLEGAPNPTSRVRAGGVEGREIGCSMPSGAGRNTNDIRRGRCLPQSRIAKAATAPKYKHRR